MSDLSTRRHPTLAAAVAALAVAAAAAAPARAAVVAGYTFEEGPPAAPAVGTVTNTVGGGLNGTLLNVNSNDTSAANLGDGVSAGPVYVTGGQALAGTSSLDFDGANDHVFLGANTALAQGVSNVRLSARIAPDVVPGGGAYASIVNIGRGGAGAANSRAILQFGNNGEVRIGGRELDTQASAGFLSTAAGVIATGNTYDVTGLIDYATNLLTITVTNLTAGTAPLVVTGTAPNFDLASLASSDTPSFAANIGSTPNGTGEFFNGRIDNVVIEHNVVVPEPAAIGLLVPAALTLLARRRRGGRA